MTALILALTLLSSPAHADWCQGIIISNGTCIGSQGNTDPPTINCDDYPDRHTVEREPPKSTPRRADPQKKKPQPLSR